MANEAETLTKIKNARRKYRNEAMNHRRHTGAWAEENM